MSPMNEVVIAVMGLTGTGKSSLIQNATGDSSVYVENKLHSGTQEVKSYKLQLNGTKYVLIDTPGFDDPLKSDTAVVDKILEWLETSYRAGRQLSGIIYLHRIIDPRMQGSALRNMRMFRKLCGPDCYKNVVLATTFWNKVSEATGQEREKELITKDEFWGQMVKKESQVVRLGRDKDSALGVIGLIKQDDKILLQAQKELVIENKSRDETAAAVLVNEEAKRLERERQRRLVRERDEAERQLRAREAERARKAKEEKDRLAAELKEQARINRERQEKRERQEREMQLQRQKAKDEAAKAERERVAKEKARIKEQEDAQRRRQEVAAREAAQRRAQYYRSFRCANITPRGYCDRCKVHKLSHYKYYFHCCHCFTQDNYWHCGPCGGDCGNPDHPMMRMGETDDCIIM